MLGQKKEIFIRRRTINGQTNVNLPLERRLHLFVQILNSLSLSRAFDRLFAQKKPNDGIVITSHGKVDKNLFDYLLRRNETSFSDLRSRSPINGSKSIYSRSKTPLKRKRRKRDNNKGSVAGSCNQQLEGKRHLFQSQHLARNPKFFKMSSELEIPLSSMGHKTKSGRRD